ncbi:hypothetical protein Tco_0122122 [Tanacetum coccineum]
MSTHEQITNNLTSAVRNTEGRNGPQGLEEPMSDEVLREMCDKNYHQLLPLIAEKMQKEKEQKDKLNAVKARLIYGEESGIKSREESHYSESKTPTARTEPRRRHGRQDPLHRGSGHRKKEACLIGWEERSQLPPHVLIVVNGVPKQKELSQEGIDQTLIEDDLSHRGHVEERNQIFTPLDPHFSLPRTRMPSHVKTVRWKWRSGGSLKVISIEPAKSEVGHADMVLHRLGKTILQVTKYIKDPVEIHHIKQRDGESTEDFMERYKAEVLDVEGAPECMRISGFMHGITHPGLIKRLYERIPRSVDEMYRMTTSFLQGEVAALSHGRRKASSSWKPSEGGGQTKFQERLQK